MKKQTIPKILSIIIFLLGAYLYYKEDINKYLTKGESTPSYEMKNIPKYNGEEYVIINNNQPIFDDKDIITDSFELYGKLDSLKRTTSAYANIGIDSMPTKERENIGMIKPSGWHTIKYDIVNGHYLYNRCHLIGYQLTGENANKENLITCTRQMNTGIMLEYENQVASYIKETKNHVLYRSIPIYEGDNLLATGIHLEALSVEDHGKGIKFNIFIYNVQDGIEINYKTGESKLKEGDL